MIITKLAAVSLIVAALMVIPVAMFSVSDDSSSAGPIDYLTAPEINYDKLTELISSDAFQNESPVPADETVDTAVLDSGEYKCLVKNFEFSKDACRIRYEHHLAMFNPC